MIKKSARFNYLLLIYIAGMVMFALFRMAETVAYCATTDGPDDFGGLYWKALLTGLRFDTVVSCYVLALPLILMIVGEMARIRSRWYYSIIHYLLMVLYTVCFFACAADIPYFCYFFNRLDVVALTWAEDFGTSASMIFSEPQYALYLVVFLVVTVAWWLVGRWIFKRTVGSGQWAEALPYGWSIPLAALLLGLGFLGMRGKLSKIPIRVSTAYFCSNPFLNQIGLNPVFTFIKSVEDAGKSANRAAELVDEATVCEVLEEWSAMPVDSTLTPVVLPEGMNVVLVLMESMSADKTSLGSAHSLSPCLDSLMGQSLTFREAWSAGIHTHNGIYASLYGHPAILAHNLMKSTPMPRMCGLPHMLRDAGYSTTYFMAHDEDFDGMRGFLYQNGFDRVVGQHTWPRREVIGTWGIPDHVLFDHVLEHCDSMASQGPFFACVMTCSDHGPYLVPDGIDFRSDQEDKQKRVAEYADWSIGRFVRMAERKAWFDNTLFVFIADHGASLNPVYDMALAYNHVPLLFFAPRHIAPRFDDRLAMQIDVAPTILAMLGLNGGHRMLGTDLTTHTRRYAYFSADDKIGVVDGELFYLFRAKTQDASLYRYKESDTDDLIGRYPDRAEAMRRHALGLTQASQQMLLDGTTNCNQ